jgi:tight adherence protein B
MGGDEERQMSVAMAFLSAACGTLAVRELLGGAASRAVDQASRTFVVTADVLTRLGQEGRDPGARERRRLLLAGAGVAFAGGAALVGPAAGLALAALGPVGVSRVLRARRARYGAAVDAGVAGMAVALADALGGGHSLRGALREAARSVDGAAGHELRRTAAELAAGAVTADALEALRSRTRSARLDTVVAACLLQHRAGGDLARLLRESARAMEDQSRLEGEVRAATAQARFTGLLVVVLPLGGALLTELASPGFVAGLASSLLTAWLVGAALGLQVVAAVLMHRLGRVRW